ncbi:catalase-like protein, partial [Leptotrombidium deliense]
ADRITTMQGQPLGNIDTSKTCGARGPLLVEDHWFLKLLFHFDRERIPERIVHAKGAGAYGYFVATEPEIIKYSKAAVFRTGSKTPIFIRYSQVAGELGAADTVRDVRGFAIKFYTEDGIWDLTGNNLPVFFIRDPRLFPSFIHSQKRNPQTHLHDPNMVFDFFSLRNESAHQFMHLYSPLGLPASYRYMNGFGVHTFKLINAKGEYVFCKFNYESNQGIRNLTEEEAMKLAGSSPDFLLKDLYDAIARGEFPSWTFYVQIMTKEQAAKHIDNPFDATKTWDRDKFPYMKVGHFVLNMNPTNYFADVEQSAFSPANMPPGIEPSPDKLLQGRLFSYLDTQFYRLGANFNQLPVNRAKNKVITPQDRDGHSVITDNFDGMPNYLPNSFLNAEVKQEYIDSSYPSGDGFVARHDFDASRNLVQANQFYVNLSENDKKHLVNAMGGHLSQVTEPTVKQRMLSLLDAINADLGKRVRQIVEPAWKGKTNRF